MAVTADVNEGKHLIRQHPVFLLVDHRGKSLLPLNQRALEHTQKSAARLRSEYGASTELLLPTGEVLPVIDFVVGESSNRLPSWLARLIPGAERQLTLVFGPSRHETLEQTKQTVLEYLSKDTHEDEWVRGQETWEQLLKRVAVAKSHGKIFEALHLLTADDWLDVFS